MELSELIKEEAKKFREVLDKGEIIRIITHLDTDGISSAAILAKALHREDKKFWISVVKTLELEMLKELEKEKIIVFLDLGSGFVNQIEELAEKTSADIFILDHHQIKGKADKVHLINSHLGEEKDEISASNIVYEFCKELDSRNKNLAALSVLGMVGDILDEKINKFNSELLNHPDIVFKKGLKIFFSSRPLNKALEFSYGIFIPGVTGNSKGSLNFLRELNIPVRQNEKYRTVLDLDKDELSRLVTAIEMKKKNGGDIIGNIFMLKLFGQLEDAREISTLINSCSRLGKPHIALSLCMGSRKAREKANEIYADYKVHLVKGLNYASNCRKIEGNSYLIINAKNEIRDTIIGTIMSILSSSYLHKDGTILVGMAYRENSIKVSMRLAGRKGKSNLKEIIEKVARQMEIKTFGGHQNAAGCLLPMQQEADFIERLKKVLEEESIRIKVQG